MNSKNFEMLRHDYAELASLGGIAELYAQPDPASSLIKMRLFVERVVARIICRRG